jgi:DNA-binding FadR family transcriptional regulator
MKDRRLYHSVAKKILKLIETGVFPPGSRLPGERELAEKFGVSRVTIREAEISLQALGHIKIKTGSGVYVQNSKEPDNVVIPDISAFELTEARLLFESETAALAARDISDETLELLEMHIEVMQNADNEDEAEIADRDFHLTIATAAGNSAVRYIVEKLWEIRTDLEPVRNVYASVCTQDMATRTNEHTEILEALRRHDPAAARSAMRKHFRRLLEALIDVSEEQAFEEVRRKVTQSRQRFLDSASTAQH